MGTFTPENTPGKLYIDTCNDITFSDLIEMAKNYFGAGVNLDQLKITSEYIHTRCITYDLYDPNDYDNYIVIEVLE